MKNDQEVILAATVLSDIYNTPSRLRNTTLTNNNIPTSNSNNEEEFRLSLSPLKKRKKPINSNPLTNTFTSNNNPLSNNNNPLSNNNTTNTSNNTTNTNNKVQPHISSDSIDQQFIENELFLKASLYYLDNKVNNKNIKKGMLYLDRLNENLFSMIKQIKQ